MSEPEKEYYCTTCSGITADDPALVNVIVVCSTCGQIMEIRDKEE
jgi:hypothetical protein